MERYAAFRERMTEELKKEFPDIAVRVIDRENGVKKEGFVLGGETGHIASPVIYLDELFALYEDEELTVGEIAVRAAGTLKRPIPDVLREPLFSKEKILKGIVPTVVSKEENRTFSEGVLCGDFLDLAVVYRMYIDDSGIGQGMVILPEQLLKREGILGEGAMSREELLEYAVSNMNRLLPPKLMSFSGEFCVLSNPGGFYGAAHILNRGYLSELSEKCGESMFILPSSKHELILIPESHVPDPDALYGMVEEVNRTAVLREDYLSDNVYFYDRIAQAVLTYREVRAAAERLSVK